MNKIRDIELAGKSYTVKINNATLAQAERQLERPITKLLQDGLGIEALHVILWCGIRNFDRKIKLPDIYDLVEQETDENPDAYANLMEMVVSMILASMGIKVEEETSGNASTSERKLPKPSESA